MLLVKIQEIFGRMVNWPLFVFWRIKYKAFPKTRGKIFVRNYGKISVGENVRINSNMSSSQLGFYPKTILHTSRTGVISIGDNVGLSNATLNSRMSITLEKNVRLGAGVKVYDSDFHQLDYNPDSGLPEQIPCKPVCIKEGAFVGAGSIILKGVIIGQYSIVGAGSVVTHTIPANQIWAGNPARFIKNRDLESDS